MPIRGFTGFSNTAARPGAAQARPCAGLGCPWDAVAGRCSWEAEQALWDILFVFLWLQGGRLARGMLWFVHSHSSPLQFHSEQLLGINRKTWNIK